MGDPAGSDPERLAKRHRSRRHGIAIGGPRVLRAPGLQVAVYTQPAEARVAPGVLEVIASAPLAPLPPLGQVSAASGRAAHAAILAAFDIAGPGIADPASLECAFDQTLRLQARR